MRKTPTQARAETTRRNILASTLKLLEKEEPEKIGTVQVAEAAGVPVGSVYRYFEDRGDIYRTLGEDLIARIEGPLKDILETDLPMPSLVEKILGFLTHTLSIAEMKLMRLMHLSPGLYSTKTNVDEHLLQMMSGALERRGCILKGQELRAATRVILVSMLGVIEYNSMTRNSEKAQQIRLKTIDMVRAYLATIIPDA